jgi:hypothetical protein
MVGVDDDGGAHHGKAAREFDGTFGAWRATARISASPTRRSAATLRFGILASTATDPMTANRSRSQSSTGLKRVERLQKPVPHPTKEQAPQMRGFYRAPRFELGTSNPNRVFGRKGLVEPKMQHLQGRLSGTLKGVAGRRRHRASSKGLASSVFEK